MTEIPIKNDTALLIGAHLSTSKGLPAALQNALGMGAECLQIFTSSPQMWRGKKYSPADAEAFQSAQSATGVSPVVSHDSYLINLASVDAEILAKSRQAFREEIERCGILGVPMIVTHLGSFKDSTLPEGISRLAESLNLLIPVAEDNGVQIVLETTAGQGSYVGGDFAQFPQIFEQIPAQEKLGVCLDTCHIFVAGYELRTAEAYETMWQEFDQHIGLNRLCVIHLNDTEKALGSHSDRHANIGTGQLGEEPFRLLLHDQRLKKIPKILETPGTDEDYARNLEVLRKLARS